MRIDPASLALATAVLMLSACGGSSSGGGGGDSEPPVDARSCQEAFDPDKIGLAGQSCAPLSGTLCPTLSYGDPDDQVPPPRGELIPCDGVTVTEHEVTVTGVDAPVRYLAVRSSTVAPESLYLQLHYLNASIETHVNQLRLMELAKARKVFLVVPQAPALGASLPIPDTIFVPGLLNLPGLELISLPGLDLTGALINGFLPELTSSELLNLDGIGQAFRRWPNNYRSEPIDDFVVLLDEVLADARTRFITEYPGITADPLYVGGLSNGGAMSYFYGCARRNQVAAIIATGANLAETAMEDCPALPAVIMGGTNDAVAPYGGFIPNTPGSVPGVEIPGIGSGLLPLAALLPGDPVGGPPEIYADFRAESDCVGSDVTRQLGPSSTPGDNVTTVFTYTNNCIGGTRMYLVTAINGGHTWPGQDNDTFGLNFTVFGGIPRNWDASIYGYDLLKLAAGNP